MTSSVILAQTAFFIIIMISWFYIFDKLDMIGALSFKNAICAYASAFFYLYYNSGMMMVASCVHYQYRAANILLKKFLRSPPEKSISSIIKNASNIHDQICDICDAISAFYLINIVFLLISFSIFNMFSFYSLYIFIRDPRYRLGYFMLSAFVWLLYYGPCLLWTITYSVWIQREGLKALKLIQQLALRKATKQNIRKLLIAMEQMTHREPKISCALFDLNWKFLFSFAGGIFSSTIILIQFYDVAHE